MLRALVILLVAGAALAHTHPAAAQPSAKPDDARACATGSGPPAIDACTRALASHRFTRSELALLHYRRGTLLHDASALDRAIKDFTAAIHLNGDVIPMSADAFDIRISQRNAYLNRGRTFADMNDDKQALADFDMLLRADPKDRQALAARAQLAERTGACDRAVADYDAIIALDPKSVDSLIGRARCSTKLGGRERAITDYRAALALDVTAPVKAEILAALDKLGAAP
jgi:tetratricopeptide (TPR) repeat protein